VMSVSISSFLSFNKSQALQTAQLGVVNMLQQAKSEAESQVNPCSTTLQKYEVKITPPRAYELDVACSPATVSQVSGKNLPGTLSFGGSNTIIFPIMHGLVTTGGTITIQDQSSHTQTIDVDSLGNIKYSH